MSLIRQVAAPYNVAQSEVCCGWHHFFELVFDVVQETTFAYYPSVFERTFKKDGVSYRIVSQ